MMVLMVNEIRFRAKPKKEIIKDLAFNFDVRDLTMAQICRAIEQGQTIRPGVFDKSDINKDSWKHQQLFFVDIDEGLSVEESFKICEHYQLEPNIVYPTFSYTPENQKYRIVFCLEEALYDADVADEVRLILTDIFHADKNVQRNQIFFGSHTQFFFDSKSRIQLDHILNLRNQFIEPTI